MQVLITGAAGLIGSELCGALTDRGHAVAALLHRSRTIARNDGGALPQAAWWPSQPRPAHVAVLTGDVAEADLGLPPDVAGALAGSVDLVVHCAAVTAFNLAPAEYLRINRGGAERVLAFTAGRRTPVLHVSTAYVCGERSGRIPEAPPEGPLANGYEASKAAAEALMRAAAAAGRCVAIARPSIVIGSSVDGAVGAFGHVYQMLRLVTQGRIRALPAAPGASLDLVPIDHVVGGLADIAEQMERAAGRIFHLASGSPVPLAGLAPLAAGFPQFCVPRFVPPEQFDPAALAGRERWLHDQATALYATYLRRDPRFVTDNLRALSGRVCPPTDAAFLRRMVGYAVASGFLPGPAAGQRTSG